MAKDIKYTNQAKEAIKAGIDKVANAVKVTMGPAGKAVILDKGFGSPTITDDGVTVAKEIELEDKFGRKFDLVTYKSVNPLLKKSIFEDEVTVLWKEIFISISNTC